MPVSLHAVEWQYTVRPGENLWELAARFCGSHTHADLLASHNGLASPEALAAGTRLEVPVECLVKQPAAARVIGASSGARLERNGQMQPLAVDQEIRMGDVIHTTEGFARVQFADRSLLVLRPNSAVAFILISAYGETGMVDTLVRVRRGQVRQIVEGKSAGSRHRIATPVGIAAVRGTDYRVSAADLRATVGTTEGLVEFVAPDNQTTQLPKGSGLVATPSGTTKETLLPAPVWRSGETVAPDGELVWEAVAGAQNYKLTLTPVDKGARNTDGHTAERVVSEARTNVALEPGEYEVAVRGVSASGLDGFELVQNIRVQTPPTGLAAVLAGQLAQLNWSGGVSPYLIELQSGSVATTVQTDTTTANADLAPGSYEWRVIDATGVASAKASLDVAPSAVTDLRVERFDKDTLAISWSAQGANEYVVQVSGQPGFSQLRDEQVITGDQAARLQTGHCGRCYVRVQSTADGLTSAYTTTEFADEPRTPWPLYILLTIGTILAL